MVRIQPPDRILVLGSQISNLIQRLLPKYDEHGLDRRSRVLHVEEQLLQQDVIMWQDTLRLVFCV